MRDHHVPACAEDVAYVALVVRTRYVAGQQIAAKRKVPKRAKGVADGAAVLASDKDAER
jgi:hypothetical protein